MKGIVKEKPLIETIRRIWNLAGYYTAVVPSPDCPGLTEIQQTDGTKEQKIIARLTLTVDELECLTTMIRDRYPEAQEEEDPKS